MALVQDACQQFRPSERKIAATAIHLRTPQLIEREPQPCKRFWRMRVTPAFCAHLKNCPKCAAVILALKELSRARQLVRRRRYRPAVKGHAAHESGEQGGDRQGHQHNDSYCAEAKLDRAGEN